MMEIENWMKQYCGAVRAAFGDRVRYIGLQGSRGRGEAGPDSDIDVVCILDSCSLQDLETYRAAVKDLPDRDKLCGFVSGTAELAAWDRGELFQFRRDTTDWCGRLADLLPPEEPEEVLLEELEDALEVVVEPVVPVVVVPVVPVVVVVVVVVVVT